MNLAVYEWRKLFRLPALWAFLALCLAFNGLLIATLSPYDRAFFNETSQTAKALGQRVDEHFLAGLNAIPATENRDLLRQSVTGMEDIFETYDTGELSDFYAGVVEKSPLAVTWMTWKYDLLASRVEHLAQTDAALDLYAGPATYGSHQFLGWSDGEGNLYAAGDVIANVQGNITLTAVYLSDTVTVDDATSSSGLAAAGVKLTIAPAGLDISSKISSVKATGTGTYAESAVGTDTEATVSYSDPNLELTFTKDDTLASCTSGDSMEITVTVTFEDGGSKEFTVTYDWS